MHVRCQKKENKKQRLHFILHAKILLKWILQKRTKKKVTEVKKKKKKKTNKKPKPELKIAAPSLSQERMPQGVERNGKQESSTAFRWPYSL